MVLNSRQTQARRSGRDAPAKPKDAEPRPKRKRRVAQVPITPASSLETSLNETSTRRAARTKRLLEQLHRNYPDAGCALHHASAYELLVATILSAQCTDERVNKVTPELFRRYPDCNALAAAAQPELETLIHACGFFHNKAKNLIGMARRVRDFFQGQIPSTMEALLTLPGVARKTANCVLGTWFKQNEGIVVDTHVGRVAHRLGLTTTSRNAKDAEKIERDLMAILPQADWTYVSHALILHGRRVCDARKPKCEHCVLASDCPSAGQFKPPRRPKRPGKPKNGKPVRRTRR